MRVTHRLLRLAGCVAIAANSSSRTFADAYWYPAPTAFAPDVPVDVLKPRSQYEVGVAEQVTSVCFCVLPYVLTVPRYRRAGTTCRFGLHHQ